MLYFSFLKNLWQIAIIITLYFLLQNYLEVLTNIAVNVFPADLMIPSGSSMA